MNDELKQGLPSWWDITEKLSGERNALERFIHCHEPAGDDDVEFRRMLSELIEYVRSPAAPQCKSDMKSFCWRLDCPEHAPSPPAAPQQAGKSVFLANLHHFFAQTDGSYKWPTGAVGDLLKQAKMEIEGADPQQPLGTIADDLLVRQTSLGPQINEILGRRYSDLLDDSTPQQAVALLELAKKWRLRRDAQAEQSESWERQGNSGGRDRCTARSETYEKCASDAELAAAPQPAPAPPPADEVKP